MARPGRGTVDDLLELPHTHAGRWSPYAVALEGGAPGEIAGVRSGDVGVQDEGSQLVAIALSRAEVEGTDTTWLDMAAGPGGKAALLAGLGLDRGATLLAVDRTHHRAGLVAQARAAFVVVDRRSMVLDCDVTTMEHLVLAGRHAEAIAAGAEVVDRLAIAEPELSITYHRVLGRAEVALGVPSGVARVERALAEARDLSAVYEVLQCLATLVDIAHHGGPPVSPGLRDELTAIRRALGVVA